MLILNVEKDTARLSSALTQKTVVNRNQSLLKPLIPPVLIHAKSHIIKKKAKQNLSNFLVTYSSTKIVPSDGFQLYAFLGDYSKLRGSETKKAMGSLSFNMKFLAAYHSIPGLDQLVKSIITDKRIFIFVTTSQAEPKLFKDQGGSLEFLRSYGKTNGTGDSASFGSLNDAMYGIAPFDAQAFKDQIHRSRMARHMHDGDLDEEFAFHTYEMPGVANSNN